MQQRPIPLFVNPTAGRGRAAHRAKQITRLLHDADIDFEEIHSSSVGDLEYKVLAAASTGAERIIVAGGDGSVHEAVNGIQERLSHAFLLNSSVIRSAERVTAEEIRMVAQELEATLGGLYSLLSQEFQMPVVNRLIAKMTKQKRLPKLPKDLVKPTIVTGVEALGRGNDLAKLDMFVAGVGQIMGPEIVSQYMDTAEYLRRRGAAVGIDTNGLVKNEQQIQQEAQQAQMMQAAMTLGKPAIDSATKQVMQAQETEQPQP